MCADVERLKRNNSNSDSIAEMSNQHAIFMNLETID